MRHISKYLAMLLALALAAGICGCAGGQTAPPVETAPQTASPRQSFYAADFRTLAEDAGQYLSCRTGTAEGYYASGYTIEEGEQGSEYSTAIYFVSYSGGAKKLEGYNSVEIPEEMRSLPFFYSSTEILGLAENEKGQLISVESVYMSWYAGPGERRDEYGAAFDDYMRVVYIRTLDKNGRELDCAQLQLAEGENIYADDLIIDSGGNLVMTEQNQLRFYSQEGEEMGRLELEGYVRSVLSSDAGELAVLCYGEGDSQLLHFISAENVSVERTVAVPSDNMHFCISSGEIRAGYTSGNSFYAFDLESGESRELFNWLSCGVNVNSISDVKLMEDGSVQCVLNRYDDAAQSYSTQLVRVSLHPGDSEKYKETLRLGSLQPDNELIDNIAGFNRSDAPCRIELINYSLLYDLDAEGQKGRAMIEILSGNVPDILDLSGLNHELLASRGWLEDLYPYLDADPQLQREDFFPNVLSAWESDGKLCAVGSFFSVDAVLASAERVGTDPGWSYEDYYNALQLMPPGCQPFEVYITSEDMLRNGLAMELQNYVNWTELTADFENDNFISLLKFCGSFPDSFNWDSYDWSDADIVENRLLQQRQMLLRTSLFSIEEIFYNSIYFGGDVSYIGYPTWDGSVGNVLSVDAGLAISRGCSDKDTAWQFVRGFLTEEFQETQWGFPSNKNAFEAQLEKVMTPSYLTDAEGQPIVDEGGNHIELAQGNMGTVLGVRGFYSLTQQQAQQLRQVLTTCEKRKTEQSELSDLIVETCRLYFDAQRGAEVTAALVEDAVDDYLSQYR